jgi:D-xylonolactonase
MTGLYIPELIADTTCSVGEGPLWHEDDQKLYWVDILTGEIFRYDPATKSHEVYFNAGEMVGGFTIQADGSLALFMAKCAVKILRDGKLTTVIDSLPGEEEGRFNDVIADPQGRVFCGTMPIGDRLGSLYRFDFDGTMTVVVENVDISNGLGFTPDLTGFYHTDSNGKTITYYDYDRVTGEIDNGRNFVTVPENAGVPDGMTVDVNGDVWSARWDGNALYRYTPDGVERQKIEFPAKKVASLTFGGPDYSTAYVTTAGGKHREVEGSGAGAVFQVDLGVKGRAPFRSQIGLS